MCRLAGLCFETPDDEVRQLTDQIGSCDTLTESTDYSAPSKEDSGLHDMVESPRDGDAPPAVCVVPATPRVHMSDQNPLSAELSEYGAVASPGTWPQSRCCSVSVCCTALSEHLSVL